MSAPAAEETAYAYAVLRVVPHVHRGAFVNVGVVVHARTADWLTLRTVEDEAWLRARLPGTDVELLARYLASLRAVAGGAEEAGAVALCPPSERFHWLTAPRSDVLQCGPVHEGLCRDLPATAERLFATYVDTLPHTP